MSDDLKRSLATLASQRAIVARLETRRDEMRADLQALPEYLLLQEAESYLKIAVNNEAAAASAVRELALAAYAETRDKHPGGAVTIRVGKTANVTHDDWAKEWAIQHNHPDVLKVDAKAIGKLALAGIPVDGVTIEETVTAAIDKDLSAFLEA